MTNSVEVHLQGWIVTKNIYSSTVLKYKFEVLVLYFYFMTLFTYAGGKYCTFLLHYYYLTT